MSSRVCVCVRRYGAGVLQCATIHHGVFLMFNVQPIPARLKHLHVPSVNVTSADGGVFKSCAVSRIYVTLLFHMNATSFLSTFFFGERMMHVFDFDEQCGRGQDWFVSNQ